MERISGTIGHVELLSHIIQARNKQRQIIVSLLDLKNGFGEVDHQLMLKVLEYHRLQTEIKTLITDCYDNYAIFVGTDDYSTEPIIVGKGVLQSSLLFNMIVNKLTKSIGYESVCCVGYSPSRL